MIAPGDYSFLTELLHRHSGLSLGAGKEYLIESRLTPVAASLGFKDLADLVRALRQRTDKETVRRVCEAMTTNESSFFRDVTPFEYFRNTVMPELLEARRMQRSLRIWCAAASTGQEPYTIGIILDEMSEQLSGWRIEILATDYSRPALDRAREGVYNHFEVQRGLPIQRLMRHFVQEGTGWKVRDHVRRMVRFDEANLLESFAGFGTFDVIFCRNVLIYFDLATKKDVLDRLARAVRPDGYLFLGGSETTMGITECWDRILSATTSVYRPSAAGANAMRIAAS